MPMKEKAETMLRKSQSAMESRIKDYFDTERDLKAFMSLMISYSRDENISRCSPQSFMTAAYKIAELRLSPVKQLGQVYMVPFSGSVEVIVGYKGMIELARRTGKVSIVQCKDIYSGDIFQYGFGTPIKWVPYALRTDADKPPSRGTHVGEVVLAQLHIGDITTWQVDFYTVDELMVYKEKSKSKYIWDHFPMEALRKTAIRRSATYWPQGIEFSKALAEDTEHGHDNVDISEFKVVDDTDEQESEDKQDEISDGSLQKTPRRFTIAAIREALTSGSKTRGDIRIYADENNYAGDGVEGVINSNLENGKLAEVGGQVYVAGTEPLEDDEEELENIFKETAKEVKPSNGLIGIMDELLNVVRENPMAQASAIAEYYNEDKAFQSTMNEIKEMLDNLLKKGLIRENAGLYSAVK